MRFNGLQERVGELLRRLEPSGIDSRDNLAQYMVHAWQDLHGEDRSGTTTPGVQLESEQRYGFSFDDGFEAVRAVIEQIDGPDGHDYDSITLFRLALLWLCHAPRVRWLDGNELFQNIEVAYSVLCHTLDRATVSLAADIFWILPLAYPQFPFRRSHIAAFCLNIACNRVREKPEAGHFKLFVPTAEQLKPYGVWERGFSHWYYHAHEIVYANL